MYLVELLTSPEAWIALATLAALEIVLGIDNIIFITILVGRVPPEKRDMARRLGLGLAMISRIALLISLAWLAKLTDALFVVMGNEISWRDIILGVPYTFSVWLWAPATDSIDLILREYQGAEIARKTVAMTAEPTRFFCKWHTGKSGGLRRH